MLLCRDSGEARLLQALLPPEEKIVDTDGPGDIFRYDRVAYRQALGGP
jgi:hypothetical protein